MKSKTGYFFAIFCLFVLSFSAFAQKEEPKFDFYTRAPYRENVPRPQSILRYDVGDFHTTYAQMERVIESIAKAAPDRVRIYDIGETNEHRMQHLVAISSPENLARLDEIKGNIARLADPRATDQAQANQIIAGTPAIVWLAYTIHGNESASFETMMQVVYQLAASDEPATQEILKNTVALILTGENPDGHERFVTWYNSVGIGSADRNALEHREPWTIWGRYNRFRFDLNRDNIAATQRETQNMQRAFFDWNPQVLVDHHGQPSQYFFPPAALPINPNLPQPATNKWLDIFGRANAAAFDQRQWDYYVRDIFDLFYPGYWDSFPSLAGAIGMTYETDGGGFKGLRWTREDGTIATLRGAIAKHYVASLATLETAAKNREARLRDFYEFKRGGIAETNTERIKRVVIDPRGDWGKAADLLEILRRMKIEVRWANQTFRSPTAHSYAEKNAPATTRDFNGVFVIDLAQPQKRLIKALLEQDTPQDRAFVEDQMAKFRRNELRGKSQQKEEYAFYDITAWSLPLAFGLDAYWTEEANAIPGATIISDDLLKNLRATQTAWSRAQIAYILPYDQDAVGAAVYRLQKEGFKVSVATRTLNAVGQNFPAGTFVVRVTRNPETIHAAVERLTNELGLRVFSANTGFQEAGDTGVGGEAVVSLKLPKIAIAAEEGIDQTSFGSIWWTLDRYKIDVTPMSLRAIRGGGLNDYNVLILPDGSSGNYQSVLNGLKDWINRGGTVIAVKGAAVAAALKDVNLTSSRLVGSDDDTEASPRSGDDESKRDEAETTPSPTPTPRGARPGQPEAQPTPNEKNDKMDFVAPTLPPIASPSANRGRVPEAIPGAIMRGTVDRTTWLSYGVRQNEIPVLVASGYFFRLSREGSNAVIFEREPKKPLTLSGFVWEGNTERLLKGTAYIIDEPTGRGHVILFAEEPFFRGIFRTTTRMFFNSLLFPSTM